MRKIITRIILISLCVTLVALATVTGALYGRFSQCRSRFSQTAEKWSQHYCVEKELVYAIIYAESGGDINAVSHAGAVGLMQLMPDTAKWLADREKIEYSEDMLNEPEFNIRLGCALIAYLETRFDSLENLLAAYNAGAAKVDKWLADPQYSKDGVLTEIPYPETKNYVKKVCFLRKIYQKI